MYRQPFAIILAAAAGRGLTQGALLVQTHGGEIRWHGVFLGELDSAETWDWLAQKKSIC